MLRYVIFDMDGVLIDSEPIHALAAKNAIARYGVTVDISYCYRFIGSTTRFMIETVISEFHMNVTIEELLLATEEEKKRLTIEYGYIEVPYVCSLIADLSKHGVKLAVASSSNPEEIEKTVSALHVKKYFHKLVSGCMVTHPKPAPDVFLKAVEELHANIEECLIIEDSTNGLLAAKAAHIPAIGFHNPNSGKQDLSTACMIIEGFEEIDYLFLSNVYNRIHHIPITITQTKRLFIRELSEEDIPTINQIYQNKEVTKYIEPFGSLPLEIEKQKAYIENIYYFYGYGIWGIFELASNQCIGKCGIENKIIDGQAEFELSYVLDYSYWGHGYALEAVKSVLDYAKKQMELERIVAIIDKKNIRSIHFIKRLGFLFEKELYYQNHACYLYSLILQVHNNKKRKASAIVKNNYQKHPDTSVYGKRYS